VHDIKKKIVVYDTKKKIPKIINISWYDKFSRWNAKFDRIYTLWKIHIYSTMINKKMWSIRETIYNFNNQVAKKFIWINEKRLKKTHSPFVK
jgi:hypothetical protein